MTFYRVPVADELLAGKGSWPSVHGLRLISVDGAWPDHPHVTICTFEDDFAPASYEGLLVEPALTSHADGRVTVTDRTVVREP